jgi:hypothetical protein
MLNTATITDIRWSDMALAGIDTNLVDRGTDSHDGSPTYVATSADGKIRVTFSPAIDMTGDDGETDLGWNACVSALIDDSWDNIAQFDSHDRGDLLEFVAHWIAP